MIRYKSYHIAEIMSLYIYLSYRTLGFSEAMDKDLLVCVAPRLLKVLIYSLGNELAPVYPLE